MEDYPSNSYKSRNGQVPKADKVVTGEVMTKKKSGMQKLAETFISEDVENVKSYIIFDVIIPTIKNVVLDAVTNSVQMLLFGKSGNPMHPTSASTGVPYTQYYNQPITGAYLASATSKDTFNFDDIVFRTRGDAELALNSLNDMIVRYTMASVANLYEAAGIVTSNYMANDYGWTDLIGARVINARGGYVIKLPKPIHLD